MAPDASGTSTPVPERHRSWRVGLRRTLAAGPGLGPAAMAGASLLCLLIGLPYLALQIRTVFSEQLKQEYIGLVLEAVESAESARSRVGVWQLAADGSVHADDYRRARVDLAARLASLNALVNASPFAAPHLPRPALAPGAGLDEEDAALSAASTYWRAERDRNFADMRMRVSHVAKTLIVLSTLLFAMLVTALAMYAKRARQLAGESRKFEQAALHDPMTGLPNRGKLLAALSDIAEGTADNPAPQKIAVLYIDLDGFKQVNDAFGHRVGDEFLIAVAARFRRSVRASDLVARIGGDEFAVLVHAYATDDDLDAVARRLIACVCETDKQMETGFVRASIGIASFPDRVDDPDRLVAVADETMYQVKRNGKDGYAFAARLG
jgi:diguanylate cyclase (GGDEF)-like protein